MGKFTTLTSVAAPLPQDNIDTDIIFPARFLLLTGKAGLGCYGFNDWRGRPDYSLDQAPWIGAAILVAGANFGCGSSREHAPWALHDMGVRCIIAPSFGEIFFNNCFKNGLLAIVVDPDDHAQLLADAHAGAVLTVDLAAGTIDRPDKTAMTFAIDTRKRDALLNGWDEVDLVLASHSVDIRAFEHQQRLSQPWLWRHDPPSGDTTHG